MAAESDDITNMRMKLTGDVQGVGFREFAVREANALKLIGWVRNRSDKSIEIAASGPTKAIEKFVGLCMKGPPGARVRDVELAPGEKPDTLGFTRRPTV